MSELKYELLEQYVSKASRRNFMSVVTKLAGIGSATVAAAMAQTTGGTTTTTSAGNDINILNYALTLEFLEATFYTTFVGAGAAPAGSTSLTGLVGTVTGSPKAYTATDLSGSALFTGFPAAFTSGLFSLFTQIRDHETTHVATLISVIKSLGGTPTQPCTYTFPVASVGDFLTVAQALENTGVSAYDGAINMISNPMLVQAGATIATVEARHASFLNLIAGGGLASGNFAPAAATGTPGPGISNSPFPTAFDTPLTMSQILAIAKPFLTSCPLPLANTTVLATATPAASATAPFSASSVTLDLSNSVSGTGQPIQQYSFSVPASASTFCPTGAGAAVCPLTAAILQTPNSSKAIIQFVSGSGYYPIQVTITDSAGNKSSQILILTYQASGGATLPAGTPGLTTMNPPTTTTTTTAAH